MLNTYSYSSLDTFRNCPRKFKFRYVDKVTVPRRVTADAYLGNVVHRVLRRLYERGANGVLMPLEEALADYETEWGKLEADHLAVVSDYLGVDDYQRVGREMLAKHYRAYRPFNQGTLLGTEVNLTFTLPGTPFKMRAIIDKLWKNDDNQVEIADYKTGQRLVRPRDDAFYYQMGLYQLGVRESYPMFDNVILAQYFLRMDEVVRHTMTPADLEQVAEDLRQAVTAILHAARTDEFPTQESALCNYCEYFHLCPAKRHQVMLDESGGEAERTRPLPQIAYEKAGEYLEKYRQSRMLKAEMDVLKEDLASLCEELQINKLRARSGHVLVRRKREEKFVTKTENERDFADLAAVARRLGLDEYFKLDGHSLMKEVYAKQRLDQDKLALLQPFVRDRESITVRPTLTDTEKEE